MSLAAFVLLSASLGAGTDDVPAVVGTVVDAQNRPIAGADVYLFDGPPLGRAALVGAGWKMRQSPSMFAHVQTNAKGEFEIALPVEPPPIWRGKNWLALAIHHRGLAVKTRLIERYWPARAAPIRVVLDAPRNNRVLILSPNEEPVPHARVWADQVDGVPLPKELTERLAAETDESGEAELPDVAGEMLRAIRVDSAPFGAQWAALTRSSNGGACPVTVSPVGAIRGQLLDEEGSAIAATRVRLITWVEPNDDLSGGGMMELSTDAEGRFHVPVIAGGALQVAAELPPNSPLVCTYQGTQQIEADTTNDVVIRYKPGVRARGTVLDEADRRPVAGAVVSLGSAPDSPIAESNEAGEFSGYILPGSLLHLTFVSLPRGYYKPTALVPTEPVPDGATEIVFKPLLVAAGATLFGRVVDAAGQPVADADVVGAFRWADYDGDRTTYTRSDRDGIFMLPAMATHADIKVMAVSVAGITTKPVIGNVHDLDPMTVAVDPSGALSVSGRIVDGRGQPLLGAAVRVFPVRFNQNRQAIEEDLLSFDGTERLSTDADGRFVTPKQLRPDRGYCVIADAPGMTPVRTEPLEPTTWHTTDFGEIVLTPAPRLRTVAGQVLDESGRPIAGAIVRQTGDGPRPTRTICDADGRFQLGGIYEGPAWLIVSHEGFRVQTERLEGDARKVRIVMRQPNSMPVGVVPRASSIAPADVETVCRALFADYRERLDRGGDLWRRWTVGIEYLLDGKLADQSGIGVANALDPRALTHEQATEVAQATDDMRMRCHFYLAGFDRGGMHDQKQPALAEALLAARAVDLPKIRIQLLAEVAVRFFDLGDREVGTAIVREAREQLDALPHDEITPNGDLWRGTVAGALAYVDVPAAYALLEKLRAPQRDWFLADMARSLAAENPAESERALDRMEWVNLRYHYGVGTVHRMAAHDPQRAERIARSFPMPANCAYALGLVAEALAGADPELAGQRVEEAYLLLERSQANGTADLQYSTCGTAAALLAVVERVDPGLLEHYLARALAMRPPRPARGDPTEKYESEIAELAMAIAPYDRQTARALLEPLAPRIRSLSATGERYAAYGRIWAAFALVDPAWARQLVESLPDAPPDAPFSPRVTAAKNVIDVLLHRGASRWPWVYSRYLHARHPDTPVRER